MKRGLLVAALLAMYLADLEVIAPENLKSSFKANGVNGSITYTVSTFGDIPYTEKEYIQLFLPQKENEFGCNNLERPKVASNIGRYAWLVERSECTYAKKAFIAQQSGAYVALVYHNQANVDVTDIIPCSDTVCRLTR